jgi:hypothetical protein
VSNTLEHTRERCRTKARALLEVRKTCHLDVAHHSDGCGYYRDRYCYLRVDCRIVKERPLCWISIIDHYSGEVLFSEPCDNTPEAEQYGRSYFTRKSPRR